MNHHPIKSVVSALALGFGLFSGCRAPFSLAPIAANQQVPGGTNPVRKPEPKQCKYPIDVYQSYADAKLACEQIYGIESYSTENSEAVHTLFCSMKSVDGRTPPFKLMVYWTGKKPCPA